MTNEELRVLFGNKKESTSVEKVLPEDVKRDLDNAADEAKDELDDPDDSDEDYEDDEDDVDEEDEEEEDVE